MRHTYIAFYYHFVWATKGRERFIVPDLEARLFGYIRSRCPEMDVFVYEINGMPDHVHLVCSVPPRVAISDFIEKIKGASAHFVNHVDDGKFTLYWQRGYSGHTFEGRDLERVREYVRNQKQHHADGTLWPSLERFGEHEEYTDDLAD